MLTTVAYPAIWKFCARCRIRPDREASQCPAASWRAAAARMVLQFWRDNRGPSPSYPYCYVRPLDLAGHAESLCRQPTSGGIYEPDAAMHGPM